MTPKPEQKDNDPTDQSQPGPLVPIYGGSEIVPGIQAFRRGDMILYSVRGEPEVVRELMGQLHKEGVEEVVAFISHRTEQTKRRAEEAEEGEEC